MQNKNIMTLPTDAIWYNTSDKIMLPVKRNERYIYE